jgi:hypothetical protein
MIDLLWRGLGNKSGRWFPVQYLSFDIRPEFGAQVAAEIYSEL